MGEQNLATRARAALDAGEGILRLAPTWVPRSFLMPGARLEAVARRPLCAGHAPRRHRRALVRLHDARGQRRRTARRGPQLRRPRRRPLHAQGGDRRVRRRDDRPVACGTPTSAGRSTASSSTTSGRSRTTCTRTRSRRPSWAARASPRATTSPRSSTGRATTSPTRSWASSRGRPRRTSAAASSGGTSAITASWTSPRPIASSPAPAGWCRPCVLHAPGSLVTYEPQWGSDVFGMYQSMVEGRRVPWELLVKDVPPEHHQDLDYLVEQLDWEKNVDPEFKKHNYLEPIIRTGGRLGGLLRPLDRLRPGQRQAALQRLRADRLSPGARPRSRTRAPMA